MVSTFTSLPIEVQLRVFKNVDNSSSSNIYECILVCKNWRMLNQKLLYGSVRELDAAVLCKFFDTVRNNPDLGALVKRLIIGDVDFKRDYESCSHQGYDIAFIFKAIFQFLPNLEFIDISSNGYYEILSDVLLQGKLQHLTHIKAPLIVDDYESYAACVSIIKDRLTHLSIVVEDEHLADDDSLDVEFPPSEKLFGSLESFKRLENLQLVKNSDNNLQPLIEQAVERCQLLKSLNLTFSNHNDAQTATTFNNNFNIQDVLPAGVTSLKIHGNVLHDSNLTNYIIHKFPRLDTLQILAQTPTSTFMYRFQLERLLEYLSKIRNFNITYIPFKDQAQVNLVGKLWESTSKSYRINVEIRHQGSVFNHLQVRNVNSDHHSTICYNQSVNNLNYHSNIIEKYGQYIQSLTFNHIFDSPKKCLSFDSLFLHPLRYCKHLNALSIRTKLKDLDITGNDLARKENFKFLNINYITTEDSTVFIKLSELFARIDHLDLREFALGSKPSTMDIKMKETDIGTLSLSLGLPFFTYLHHHNFVLQLTVRDTDIHFLHLKVINQRPQLEKIDARLYDDMSGVHKEFLINFSFKSIKDLQVHLGYENPFQLSIDSQV